MFAGLIALFVLGIYHDNRTIYGSNDFNTYYYAGKCIIFEENLYSNMTFKYTLSPYLYLPFFAALFAPLTLLPVRGAALLWYMVSAASLIGSLYFALRLGIGKESVKDFISKKPYLLKLVSISLIVVLWVDNVSLAQIDFLIFFLIILSLFLFSQKRPFLAGIILAAAGAIKIYPLYFFFYFLVKRRFKVAAGGLIGLVLFLFIVPWASMGTTNFKASMNSWREKRAKPYTSPIEKVVKKTFSSYHSQFKPSNQALYAVATRSLMKDDENVILWKEEDFEYKIYWPHPLTPTQVVIFRNILLMAIVFLTFLCLDYRLVYTSRLYLNLEYSVIFLSMLLLFPQVKSHTFVPIIFPIIVFNCIKTDRQEKHIYSSKPLEITFWTALALFCLQGIPYLQVVGVGAYSMLLLWILFILMMRKERAALKG
ncbi:MAG: DUF2029 domain-containing protein [Candidatus Omnitrophica bacterium]|nr:DUF2029 domain-containing protein [Candidatus Omnitrophota bacterium]